jgi:hypothetical protein
MSSTHFDDSIRPSLRRTRNRGERGAVTASRPRRTGMVSEAVVASYIRELAGHGRRVHGTATPRNDDHQEGRQ